MNMFVAGTVKSYLLATVQRLEAHVASLPVELPIMSAAAPTEAAAAAMGAPAAPTGTGALIAAAVRGASIQLQSKFEGLALAVHCLMLEQDFVCTGADAVDRAMPSFAAPARGTHTTPLHEIKARFECVCTRAEVPRSVLVPAGWNADAGIASFRYSHKSARGKDFVVKVLLSRTRIFALLSTPNVCFAVCSLCL